MSDPLSVAGTAVGITSLGIQVCQGLVWYLRSIHGRRAEIAEDLSEVQSLISIFYALNDILPKINQTRCTEATTIRRCLEDSEGKLLELQQLLTKLRGTEQCTTNRERMRHTGRMISYPFQTGKLEALRQSLRGLLGNLNLAIDATSLEFQAMNQDKVDTIDKAMKDLGLQSKDTKAGVQDLNTKMQENRGQLRSLESTITHLLTEISHRVSQVEVAVNDLDSNVTGELTILGNGVASIHQGMTEMAAMLSSQSATISQLGMEISHLQHGRAPLSYDPPKTPTLYGPKNNRSRRPISPMCNCKRETRPFGFSFAFGNLQFEFQQHVQGKHHRSCKFFGIDGQTQRRIKAQFPLKLAWMSARMTLACAEYTIGTSTPGYSVRYRNVVPGQHSPVHKLLFDTVHDIVASPSADQTIQLLQGTETAILSLYRDGKASPCDRDENNRCHTEMFIETFANFDHSWMFALGWDGGQSEQLQNRIWRHNVLAIVLRILQALDAVVQADDSRTGMGSIPYFHSDGTVNPNRRVTQRLGCDLVSYLATTQSFDPDWLIRQCLQHDTIAMIHSIPELMNAMELSPMIRAIVARSLDDIKRCVSNNPKAVTETLCGFNAIHLCSAWPEGLRFFLATEARNLIDDQAGYKFPVSTTHLAMVTKCVHSLAILMEAGCRLDFGTAGWGQTSPECVEVAARRLFERRVELFKLAQEQLEDFEDEYTYDTTEIEARWVYEELIEKGISVPPAQEVNHSYTTVYHSPRLPLQYFPIFFETGFQNSSTDFNIGLAPVMIWRFPMFYSGDTEECLPWLQETGFLDQQLEDPGDLGLNVSSTAWHYLAALSCWYYESEMTWTLFPKLLQSSARDNCVCWCIHGDKGCSPLGLMMKAHADGDRGEEEGFWATDLVDICVSTSGHDISTNMSHFVRFLTFEALEMTHTCCHFGALDDDILELVIDDDGSPSYGDVGWNGLLLVILDHDEDMVQETRTDEKEQENADLLDSLMEEFNRELQGAKPSPKTFKRFLNGYWRRRMAQLFRVDQEIVDGMRGFLSGVKTYELPERAQRLLGPGFILQPQDCDVDAGSRCHAESDETLSESEGRRE